MRVRELMVRDVATCGPDTDFAQASRIMLEMDCGALPVVIDRRVLGIVTDRDIAMRLASDARSAREVRVAEVLKGPLHAIHPDDDCARALEIMAVNQLRRLPVVDSDLKLQGMLTLNDFILHVDKVRGVTEDDLSYLEVMGALKAVSRHRVATDNTKMSEARTRTRRRAREARLVRR